MISGGFKESFENVGRVSRMFKWVSRGFWRFSGYSRGASEPHSFSRTIREFQINFNDDSENLIIPSLSFPFALHTMKFYLNVDTIMWVFG